MQQETPPTALPVAAQQLLQQTLIRDLKHLFTLLLSDEQFESCYAQFQREFDMERSRRRRRRRDNSSHKKPASAQEPRKGNNNNNNNNSDRKRPPPPATLDAHLVDDTACPRQKKKKKGNNTVSRVALPSASRAVATTNNSNDDSSPGRSPPPPPPLFPLEPTLGILALNNNNSHLPPPPSPENDTIDPQTTTITTATNNNNNKLRCRIPSHQQAWEKQFHRLQAFKTVFSHVNIPHGEKCHASLYAWVKKQRLFWRQTLRGENPTCPLSQDDIARLESVGLTPGEETSKKGTSNSSNNNSSSKWHPSHQQAWLEKYYQLEQFKHTHGHLQVPFSNAPEYASLYSWLVMQKSQWRRERQGLKHRLHPEQLKMLVDVGLGSFQDGPATTTDSSAGDAASAFTGSTHNIQAKQRMQAWMEKWNQLRDFMAANGGRAPSHEEDTAHAASLFSWLKNQKYRWRKALHVAARKERDDEDDADGDADQKEGEEKQQQEDVAAAAAARLSKRGRPLCQEQMQLLIELGLGDSNGPAAGNSGTINSWDESYMALAQFYHEHGHCTISRRNESTSTRHLKLAWWIQNQKHNFKNGRLTEEQVSKLESLGFRLLQQQTTDDDTTTTNK